MKLELTQQVEYVPEWNENQKDSEPISFTLRHLTTAERAKCTDTGQTEQGHLHIKPDYERMFRLAVVKIENLDVGGKQLETARDVLATPGLYMLFFEVALYILNMNPIGDKKK